MDYAQQTALITGASAGIGAEFARQLHAEGARVVLVARRGERLNESAAIFNRARPGSAVALQADLAAQDGVRLVADYISANQIDILVNNAGRGSFGEFDELDVDGELGIVALNVIATVHLAHAVIPQMKARKRGAIVSISSIAGFQPLPFMATYAATKAFNLSHSMGLKYELEHCGVRVLTVCPGPVDTEFAGVARIPGGYTGTSRDSAESVVRESLRALKRNALFVVPGWRAKPLYYFMRITPRRLANRMVAAILRGALEAHRRMSVRGEKA
jgi:short-subunit dehydrogenase